MVVVAEEEKWMSFDGSGKDNGLLVDRRELIWALGLGLYPVGHQCNL